MRIAVVGGGPAGLFFASLMKQADPRHEVTVHERNRLDDTFGFGVVFSDATEEALAAADPAVTAAMGPSTPTLSTACTSVGWRRCGPRSTIVLTRPGG